MTVLRNTSAPAPGTLAACPPTGAISLNSPTFSASRGWEAAAELAARSARGRRAGATRSIRHVGGDRPVLGCGEAVDPPLRGCLRRRPSSAAAGRLPPGGGARVWRWCLPLACVVRGAAGASARATRRVIDVTSRQRTGRRKPGLRIHCGALVRADEVTIHDAVPCTTVARTLLDLATAVDPWGLSRAVETAERLELLDLRPLRVLIGRHAGRRGIGRLRHALAAFDPDFLRVRSELEARFLQLCIDRATGAAAGQRIDRGGSGDIRGGLSLAGRAPDRRDGRGRVP